MSICKKINVFLCMLRDLEKMRTSMKLLGGDDLLEQSNARFSMAPADSTCVKITFIVYSL